MTDAFRWGILGPGGIAGTMVRDLIENGHTVAAVGARRLEAAELFAATWGIPTAYGSYAELVADPTLDAIYVATPHALHAENALLALGAGKHVLVEKPFTLTGDLAQQVVSAAEAAGLVVLEAMWTRFLPHMVRIREIVSSGELGEIHTVIADHNQLLPSEPTHRLNSLELGGGALLDLGIYPVSFAFDVLGAPTTISALGTLSATGVDAQTSVTLGYANGAHAVLQTALDTIGPNRAAIIGSLGWIDIEPTWYAQSTFTWTANDGSVVERFEGTAPSRGMQLQAEELERLVGAGVTAGAIMPPAESVTIMRTLDAIRAQIGVVYPGE
jgi:predicted dehydrogenase